MPRPSHLPWLLPPNNIWRAAQIMRPFTMWFSSARQMFSSTEELVLFSFRWAFVGRKRRLCGSGPLMGPLSIPQIIYEWICSSGDKIFTGENGRIRRKNCLNATLSTSNPTSTDTVANPSLQVETVTRLYIPTQWAGRRKILKCMVAVIPQV
jgi:hypothetical protein